MSNQQKLQIERLPYIESIDRDSITVSGFSCGAFMASQMHVIYSNTIKGAAIISGGPCGFFTEYAQKDATKVDVDRIIPVRISHQKQGLIDPLNNIRNSRVYVQGGELETTLSPGVTDKAALFYKKLGADITYHTCKDTAHPFATDLPEYPPVQDAVKGQKLSRKKISSKNAKFPFINNCGFDSAGSALNYMYPNLSPRIIPESRENLLNAYGKIFCFDQQEFISKECGLNKQGFIFIPYSALKKENKARLHIVFHGVAQSYDTVRMAFVEDTGYIEWAASNNIILLFPQCLGLQKPHFGFDFYGYTSKAKPMESGIQDLSYTTNKGVQPQIIKKMIDRLIGQDNVAKL